MSENGARTIESSIAITVERLSRLPAWLWELRRVSVLKRCLGPLLLVFIGVDWAGFFLNWPIVDRLPVMGWVLEVLGIGTVAHGLWGLEHKMRPNPPPDSLRHWLSKNPLVRRDVTIAAGKASLVASAGRVKARLTGNLPKGKTTEESLELLRGAVERLEREMHRLDDVMTDRVDETEKKLEQEIQDRKTAVSELKNRVNLQLEDVLVDGKGWEVVGVVWIAFGLTLATIPALVWYWWQPVYELLTIL